MPSMDTIDPKNRACEIGAADVAFVRWETFAPRYTHCFS